MHDRPHVSHPGPRHPSAGHRPRHRRVPRWRPGRHRDRPPVGRGPPNPVPTPLENYLLVFPEADRRLSDEWVHFQSGDGAFPTYDLDFVEALLAEITTRLYPTGL